MKKLLLPASILLLCILAALIFIMPGSEGSGNSGQKDSGGASQEDPYALMYTSRDVNLRSGPGADTSILTVILRGESVKVFASTSGWSKVKYNNQDGYVKTSLLSGEQPPSYLQLAQEILDTMTTEEKVGQMFFVRCRKDTALADLEKFRPGGYILFGGDIKGHTKDSLKSTIQSYQDASKIKLLVGVDEEGGDIVRISKYPAFRAVPFHSPQSLYAEGGFRLIAEDTKEKAELLKSLGFNLNLAPVCDVSTDPSDYIHARTFGKGAAETAEYVRTVVAEMKKAGIGCTLKHFPGYGSNADTHKGLAIDYRSYGSFVNSDFIPFQAGIETGADSILISHNIVKSMDPSLPASLSPEIHKILREELGFDGIIMTDDLNMNAIREYIGDETSAVMAVKAGNDLILSSDFDIQIPSVLAAVKAGTISEEHLNTTVLRILEWKLRLGIIPS